MGYLVLARKYRPQTFGDVVGQEEVGRTLKRSIERDRVAHAYLFCGPRGVGKTSMARIFAKALNCPEVRDGEPCNTCDVCEDIAQGRDVDVLEIDGASNRGIDEVRGIREGAKFLPARAKHKIYIIDEVHMLTGPAFNALLKTLEEPPAHVLFLFATTHPQALPGTVRSRCQRFDFRPIGQPQIVERLKQICGAEGVEADDDALGLIADRAEGGMRDAQSLLDQMIAYADDAITRDAVEAMLGLPTGRQALAIVEALADGDAGAALARVDAGITGGTTVEDLTELLERLARDLLIVASVDDASAVPLLSGVDRTHLDAPAARLPADAFGYLAKLFGNARVAMREPGSSRVALEIALLRAARLRDYVPLDDVVAALRGAAPAAPTETAPAESASPAPQRQPAPRPRAEAPASPPSAPPVATPSPPPTTSTPAAPSVQDPVAEWERVVTAIAARRPSLGSFLARSRCAGLDGGRLTVLVAGKNRYGLDRLDENRQGLQEIVASVIGRKVTLAFAPDTEAPAAARPDDRAARPGDVDAGVTRVKEIFDGREIRPGDRR